MKLYEPINWEYIGKALSFYKSLGYKYLEAPWVVSDEAIALTLPFGRKGTSCYQGSRRLGTLVASAEQSFIELMLRNVHLAGAYVAATPCFRDDSEDILHQKYFFKVELFQRAEDLEAAGQFAYDMALKAQDFFGSLGEMTSLRQTDIGWDIELNGAELGSYGARRNNDLVWAYGTGIAEPRFSIVSQGRHQT